MQQIPLAVRTRYNLFQAYFNAFIGIVTVILSHKHQESYFPIKKVIKVLMTPDSPSS